MRQLMEHSSDMRRELVEGVKIHFGGKDSVLLMPDKESSGFIIIGEGEEYETATQLAKKYQKYVETWQSEM